MKKILLITILFLVFLFPLQTKGDELDDINTQLTNLVRDLEASKNATKPLEENFTKLQSQLNQIKFKIIGIEAEVVKKEKEVKLGTEVLSIQKKILDERIFIYYKNAKKAQVSLINLLTAENLSTSLRNFFYQKTLADQDKQSIIKMVLYIRNLEEKKATLEEEKIKLAQVKATVDQQSTFLSGEIGKAKKYQGELSGKIAALTARQQQILAQKLAGLNIPRSAATSLSGCIDDRDKDPGFSPRLAFFTYGVPNRTGMNQYGAKGRSEAGQSAEDILRAYYENFELKKDYDTGITINVDGIGSFNIEDYVKHIYEMPSDWPMEALKTQAIAARSYALAYTDRGARSICATQSCQVAKAEEKGGRWNEAVEATKGWVMIQGGNPVKAWYSSTHGGYILKSSEIGWSDTSWTKHGVDSPQSIGSFADLQNSAYDRSSPWFYCDWGSRASYNKTAWLKSQEVADIVNVLLLAKADTSIQNHLSQVDKPNPDGVDTWDFEKVKSELKNRGGNPFNNVSDVSINADFSGGKVNSVNVSGDAGGASFSGSEFKNFFNLRAPANIQIVGPLFNVEKR
ncbi:hypothetical protein A3C23_04375 [Candidatus Roizmanbacteria bacterium RIFCSPHIGHO2_02_FULL_37_13b]|uniref:Sporulation stage II protein D amidase enhancer LytB N-terminal domain-containing protein n=1 Tax=Candidatus Roizmanbacteria bacterium RIFCSPLOWO2_02_FULL_36_11 TaxID=1802071 RepID=A0A1F7JH54_9BACT|nr:MAG: hypothetical protein A3C23_04375 [Candidatus Roizmanbacteria bacterium RIFCSPHIGHO2_02_FULL_37_13b]OGK54945.1 MAG: hypothetical protein A3H78_00520 [Candidatus Roizmanbacteria bacterium RIFCSPLOWO2_02_FULL_36_11]